MIKNLPTHESLNNVALRTYFRAWSDLIEIYSDFSCNYNSEDDVGASLQNWPNEWREYLIEAQSDLQSICSLLQQSMELALKARVCAVSPYLLLLGTSMKLATSPTQIDFSELRTLDAVDLPGAVNMLTNKPVSDDFIGKYTKLRSLRNKIMHLGEAGVSLEPAEVLRLAISFYLSMWSDRHWLGDRLEFAAQTRRASLYDHKWTSPHMDVLAEWPIDIELFQKGEYKKLFGHEKAKRRYLCHPCVSEGNADNAGFDKLRIGTAYLDNAGKALGCIMCGETIVVARRKCSDCEGDVIGDNGDRWDDHCHTCGTAIDEKM